MGGSVFDGFDQINSGMSNYGDFLGGGNTYVNGGYLDGMGQGNFFGGGAYDSGSSGNYNSSALNSGNYFGGDSGGSSGSNFSLGDNYNLGDYSNGMYGGGMSDLGQGDIGSWGGVEDVGTDEGFDKKFSRWMRQNMTAKNIIPALGGLVNPVLGAGLKYAMGGDAKQSLIQGITGMNPLAGLGANFALNGAQGGLSQAGGMGGSYLGGSVGNSVGGPLGGFLGGQLGGFLGGTAGNEVGASFNSPSGGSVSPSMSAQAPAGGGGGFDLGSVAQGLAGIYGLSQQAKASNAASQGQANYTQGLADMFGPNSAYAQQLRQQLERKDAASGRRSQYGTREVELQAQLAKAAASVAPSVMNGYGAMQKNATSDATLRAQRLAQALGLVNKTGLLDGAKTSLASLFGSGSSSSYQPALWDGNYGGGSSLSSGSFFG